MTGDLTWPELGRSIDYRSLLMRYMEHVVWNATSCGPHSSCVQDADFYEDPREVSRRLGVVHFTDAEWDELVKIDTERQARVRANQGAPLT